MASRSAAAAATPAMSAVAPPPPPELELVRGVTVGAGVGVVVGGIVRAVLRREADLCLNRSSFGDLLQVPQLEGRHLDRQAGPQPRGLAAEEARQAAALRQEADARVAARSARRRGGLSRVNECTVYVFCVYYFMQISTVEPTPDQSSPPRVPPAAGAPTATRCRILRSNCPSTAYLRCSASI